MFVCVTAVCLCVTRVSVTGVCVRQCLCVCDMFVCVCVKGCVCDRSVCVWKVCCVCECVCLYVYATGMCVCDRRVCAVTAVCVCVCNNGVFVYVTAVCV